MSEPFLRQDKLKLRPPNSQERSPCSLARLKPGRYIRVATMTLNLRPQSTSDVVLRVAWK